MLVLGIVVEGEDVLVLGSDDVSVGARLCVGVLVILAVAVRVGGDVREGVDVGESVSVPWQSLARTSGAASSKQVYSPRRLV